MNNQNSNNIKDAYIITTHHNNFETIEKCLDLLFENCRKDSIVLLYVNETTDKNVLNIKNIYKNKNKNFVEVEEEIQDNGHTKIIIKKIIFEVFYIDNQKYNNGLTGTWNMGINFIFNNYPKVNIISILGHDSYVNDTLCNILQRAEIAQKMNTLEYFGPLCRSKQNTNINLFQDFKLYKKYKLEYLTGFFLTFPKNSLIKNILSTSNNYKRDFYFNEIKYPFAYNEIDWYNRFIKKGGKAILCTNCIVDHEHTRSWINIYNKINNNKSNQSIDKLDILKQVKNELQFNWMEYMSLNRDLKFKNEYEALNHYMSIGKIQNRKFKN